MKGMSEFCVTICVDFWKLWRVFAGRPSALRFNPPAAYGFIPRGCVALTLKGLVKENASRNTVISPTKKDDSIYWASATNGSHSCLCMPVLRKSTLCFPRFITRQNELLNVIIKWLEGNCLFCPVL